MQQVRAGAERPVASEGAGDRAGQGTPRLLGSVLLGLFADSAINGLVVDEGLFLCGGADLLVGPVSPA